MTTSTFYLDDDHLLMECEGILILEDGSRRSLMLPITAGDARAYRDNPDVCRCDNCLRTFARAAQLLELMETRNAGWISERKFQRELKRLGYTRAAEQPTRH
jgi:hypothetical protein